MTYLLEHDLSGSDVYYRVGTKGPLDSCLQSTI